MGNLWQKLQKHPLFRITIAYLMIGWIVMQIAEVMGPALQLPDWVLSAAAFILISGLPIVLLIAWALKQKRQQSEVQPSENGRQITTLDIGLFAAVGFVLVMVALDWFRPDKTEQGADLAQIASVTESEDTNRPRTQSGNQSGTDFSAAPAVEKNSIAVLPFADLSRGGDQAFFADGITDEIITGLNNIEGMRVTGRISSFAFKDKNIDLREIGQTLNVAYLLEGSVRRQEDRVRITAQLIEADTGFHLWSDTYDGSLEDVFAVQEDISRQITAEMQILLGQDGDATIGEVKTENSEAWEIFLQARFLAAEPSPDNTMQAINLLNEAVILDPEFAHAHALLASVRLLTLPHPGNHTEKLSGAELSALRAIAIKPELAQAHAVLGWIAVHRRDFLSMQEHFDRAMQLDADDLQVLQGYANGLFAVGRADEALPLLEKLVAADPVQPMSHFFLATAHLMLGDIPAAEKSAHTAHDLGFGGANLPLSDVARLKGDLESAREYTSGHMKNRLANDFTEDEIETLINGLSGIESQQGSAVRLIEQALSGGNYANRIHFPAYLVQLEEPELALTLFSQNRFAVDLPFWVALWSPFGKATRQHSDFSAFAENIGLVEYWEVHGWPVQCQKISSSQEGQLSFDCS
ncbi:MAG: tetratricopeptide repeat protein [Aquisalinus sp.]|nr:tetratricopeptide repeat protein [Aquisalinus sp.]